MSTLCSAKVNWRIEFLEHHVSCHSIDRTFAASSCINKVPSYLQDTTPASLNGTLTCERLRCESEQTIRHNSDKRFAMSRLCSFAFLRFSPSRVHRWTSFVRKRAALCKHARFRAYR
jgi:hypothetical protein